MAEQSQVKIGLFGLGTVGGGVVEQLQQNGTLIAERTGKQLKIAKIVTKNLAERTDLDLSGIECSEDVNFILDDPEIDIVVELIGGYTIAKTIVLEALKRGKSVVTANKALLAENCKEIFSAVYQSEGNLGFEAAVAGGIPIIRSIKEGFSGEKITEISGIINGTANYILTKMSKEGSDFHSALQQAQELGYAEADPTFDVEGNDTAHKILLLMGIAFNGIFSYDDLYVQGITGIEPIDIEVAEEFGYEIKLLGKALDRGGSYEGRVHPCLVSKENMLANVSGAFNAVEVKGNFVGPTLHYGQGAGAHPTSSAVVADIIEIARLIGAPKEAVTPALGYPVERLEEKSMLPMSEVEGPYYLRFSVVDRPGVLSQITRILGENEISIRSMIQKSRSKEPGQAVSVVMFTHTAKEANILSALSGIDQLPIVAEPTKLIRINP